jgi:uncharacterized RDD family membrane protein YckC
MGAAAPDVEIAPALAPPVPQAPPPGPQLVTELPKAAPRAEQPVQPSLFGPMAIQRQHGRTQRNAPAPPRRTRNAQPATQQGFEFVTPSAAQAGAHALPTSVHAAVYCNAPVAFPTQRAVAAAIDMAVPLVGFAIFMTTFHMVSDGIVLTARTLPFFGATLALITLFYRVLFCIGNADTIGLQWAGLRLLNFDGHRPERRQRFRRLIGGAISAISLTIGLLWALVDEEHLTWHDYMSNTFPTPIFRN